MQWGGEWMFCLKLQLNIALLVVTKWCSSACLDNCNVSDACLLGKSLNHSSTKIYCWLKYYAYTKSSTRKSSCQSLSRNLLNRLAVMTFQNLVIEKGYNCNWQTKLSILKKSYWWLFFFNLMWYIYLVKEF